MRKRVLLTVLVVLVGAAAGIGYRIDGTPAMPRPQSYRAAIARVLDAQHIDYRDVEVSDGCAPSEQRCRSYAGTVRVRTGTIMAGQIDCRERWITCTITVPQAGIRGVALDDTIGPLTARWEDVYSGTLMMLASVIGLVVSIQERVVIPTPLNGRYGQSYVVAYRTHDSDSRPYTPCTAEGGGTGEVIQKRVGPPQRPTLGTRLQTGQYEAIDRSVQV